MQTLIDLDLTLFHLINRDLDNPLFDVFFPWITNIQKRPEFLFIFLPLLLGTFIWKKNYRALKVIVLGTLVTWAANVFNHQVLKDSFSRSRPAGEFLRIELPGSSSFPSGHAFYIFCLATFLAQFYPRQKFVFYGVAFLIALSRVYLGVHYPSDIIVGGLIGALFGYFFSKLCRWKKLPIALSVLLLAGNSFALDDPTKGKPFFPWAWEDQLKPTIEAGGEKGSLILLGAGAATTLTVRQYDHEVRQQNENDPYLFTPGQALTFQKVGNGPIGVGIALLQLLVDQPHGLRHGRALLLTSVSHASIAALVRRDRPDGENDFLPYPSSFPSGHTSSAFATAGSLAYAYGWKAGIPAYTVATAIGVSRISKNRHWASDVVAGAFLGTFWARASYMANENGDKSALVVPAPIDDGIMLTLMKTF